MNEPLRAIGHPARLLILRAVCQRERSVGDLAKSLGLRQPTMSQHLRVLRRAKLVKVRCEANRRLYRANPEQLAALRAFLDGFWRESLHGLKEAAEAKARASEQS